MKAPQCYTSHILTIEFVFFDHKKTLSGTNATVKNAHALQQCIPEDPKSKRICQHSLPKRIRFFPTTKTLRTSYLHIDALQIRKEENCPDKICRNLHPEEGCCMSE